MGTDSRGHKKESPERHAVEVLVTQWGVVVGWPSGVEQSGSGPCRHPSKVMAAPRHRPVSPPPPLTPPWGDAAPLYPIVRGRRPGAYQQRAALHLSAPRCTAGRRAGARAGGRPWPPRRIPSHHLINNRCLTPLTPLVVPTSNTKSSW